MSYRDFTWYRAASDFGTLFFDFFNYAAGDWVVTTTEAGAGNAAEAIVAGPGGLLQVTNDAADNDADFFQYAGGSGGVLETFKFVEGKKLKFVFRGKIDDVAASDFFAGLYITDTDPVGGLSDGIYFRKLAGTNKLSLVVEKNSAETAVEIGELVDDTFFAIEFYYDGGKDRIQGFLNGRRAGSVPLDNAPDDEDLALSFGIQNGEAAAKVLTVDYIGATQER